MSTYIIYVYMKTYIYFHICILNNWIEISNKLWEAIVVSGLYNKVDEIRCVVLGTPVDLVPTFLFDTKVKVLYQDPDMSQFERIILHIIHNEALNATEEFRILYIHSKGITHNNQNPGVNDWLDYMSYFNIQRHEQCMRELEQCDAVGVNLQTEPHVHFSGNFWWSKSSHIRTLNNLTDPCYNGPEWWIATNPHAIYKSIWNSNINHYEKRYYPFQYINVLYLHPRILHTLRSAEKM